MKPSCPGWCGVWLGGLGIVPQPEKPLVRFLVGQGTCLGCRFSLGVLERQPIDVCLTHGCFFLFLPPVPSLKTHKNKKNAATLTLLFSLCPPRNFRIAYSATTNRSQSHLLASQPWACSGRFCLIRKCPPQGAWPWGSLTFPLTEENTKA